MDTSTIKINIKQFLSPLILITLALMVTFTIIASPYVGLFLAVILGLTVLLIINPQKTFIFFTGGLILFYFSFIQGYLFSIGNAKVYLCDLVIASLFIFLIIRIFLKGNSVLFLQKSTRVFFLFFIWGIIAIIRGIPSYSYSAVGEARYYVLPMLYYFFVVIIFRDRERIKFLIKWITGFFAIMVLLRFFEFFFFGGNKGLSGYKAFKFLNATEALLVGFFLVSLFMFLISGKIRKYKFPVYVILSILILVMIIAQVRSAWVATAGGLIASHIVLRKMSIRAIVSIALALLLLILLAPFLGNFIGEDVIETLKSSAVFLKHPEKDRTTPWRLMGWQQELQTAMQNPIFGEGLGRYSEWLDDQRKWQRVAVHNGYIMNISKFGFIGILLLLWAIIHWYVEMRRYSQIESDRYYKFLGYAIQVCVFIHLVFAFFYYFTVFFWILLGAGTAVARRHNSGSFIALTRT